MPLTLTLRMLPARMHHGHWHWQSQAATSQRSNLTLTMIALVFDNGEVVVRLLDGGVLRAAVSRRLRLPPDYSSTD